MEECIFYIFLCQAKHRKALGLQRQQSLQSVCMLLLRIEGPRPFSYDYSIVYRTGIYRAQYF